MGLLKTKSSERLLAKSSSTIIVPYTDLLPYQDVILLITKTLSFKNPIGLGCASGAISLFFLIYYLTAPSLMTSLSIGLLMVVWVDFGLNLVKKQSNETLTKDERMKLVYADYVYVITYVEAVMKNVWSFRAENEYIYVGGSTFFFVLMGYIGKSISTVLLFWSITLGAMMGLAWHFDYKLYTIKMKNK